MTQSVVPTPRTGSDREAVLLAAQLDALSEVISGAALNDVLGTLLKVVESASDTGVLGSVLLLDGDRLWHCAAPSLPDDYNAAIDGIEIGPTVGSCGTAAFRREQVIVEDIQRDPLWADFRELAAAARVRACWSTPIFGVHGDLLGTFAMYYPQPQRPTNSDLALIDVLVRTVAMAIERSRADEERDSQLAAERAAALTLQHSLLPEVPSQVGAVKLAARYRTGDPGVEVGGDWFDAITFGEGLVLVVGDVQGHDLGAAALMGQLRTVVRAYAAEGHPPASVLARANDYLSRLDSERLVTALVVHLDPLAQVVTVASAGHLPPLLLCPTDDDCWSVIDIEVEAGPPLGVGTVWPERSTAVGAGGTLLLYTDGLVETRAWQLDRGLDELRATLDYLPSGLALEAVLDAVLEIVPTGLRGDDVAVLAASLPAGQPEASRSASRWLTPLPLSVPLARSWVHGLLTAWSTSDATRDAAALVVSELVTNAFRNTDDLVRVSVSADGPDPGVLVEVFDRSHRLPFLRDRGIEDTAGRGLYIVAELAADWGVRESLDGKTVWARLEEPTQ